MMTEVNSAAQGRMHLWRLRCGNRWIFAVALILLLSSCVSMNAEDAKQPEHGQTPMQKNVPMTKHEKTKIGNSADSATCKVKSDDPAMVTKTNAGSTGESDGQERMSNASNKADSGDLTLQAPSKEEWTTDPTDLGSETTFREESRSDRSENSRVGSSLKCTRHEAPAKNTIRN